MAKTVHIENNLAAGEVAGFLRALADVLEGGCEDCLRSYGLHLHDFNKIKMGLRKGETGELFLKITVKDRSLPAPKRIERAREEDPGRQDYKLLKRKMKATFQAIGRALKEGETPAAGYISSFLADSRRMLAVPGYGDAAYPAYEESCRRFEEAAAGDAAELQEAFRDLAARMKTCHEKYK